MGENYLTIYNKSRVFSPSNWFDSDVQFWHKGQVSIFYPVIRCVFTVIVCTNTHTHTDESNRIDRELFGTDLQFWYKDHIQIPYL